MKAFIVKDQSETVVGKYDMKSDDVAKQRIDQMPDDLSVEVIDQSELSQINADWGGGLVG